jgi:polysaccharide biosynthesis transport protein
MATRRNRADNEEGGTPRPSVADIFRRRGWWGVVAFVVLLPPLLSTVRFLPDVYVSAATVLIERQQIPDELVRSTVTSALEVRLQTISQEILSRDSLVRLINQFGLYADLPKDEAGIEQAVNQMRRDVLFDLKGGDRRGNRAMVAFSIGYRGRDPENVAKVANRLAGLYIEKNLEIRGEQASETADFLRNQLQELSQKLKEQEKKVSEFKYRHLGQLPEQLDANLRTYEQLTTQLQVNGENMSRALERRTNFERELAAALGTTVPTGPDSVTVRLAQLRAQLASMLTRYSEKHPDVLRLQSEISVLESGEPGTGADGSATAALPSMPNAPQIQHLKSALLELDLQIKGLESETANLKRQLTVYQSRVEAVPRVQQEYQIMAREYETTQEMYRSLTVRERESALAERMERGQKGEQFKMIEPALPTSSPAAPKRPKLYAIAVALALAAAALAIFGPEALDPSVHTLGQLQARSDLPVLVSIPRIVVPADVRRRRTRFGLVAAGLSIAVVGLVIGSYVLARENAALAAMLSK